jgi:hypothetical protein
MSSEDDVPLGEGARHYYEQRFGDRIRQVRKSAGIGRGSGGSNWNGRAGIGAIVCIAFLVLRIFISLARNNAPPPSYTYTPPKPQAFKADAEVQKRLNEIHLQGDRQDVPPPDGLLGLAAILEVEPLLREEDVPLLQGLCYRIHRESLRPGATPGGQICKLLAPPARRLLIKAADGQPLRREEKDDLFDSLNKVLQQADFYDAAAFREVPGAVRPNRMGEAQPKDTIRFNRSLLELSYPEQIRPYRERPGFNNEIVLPVDEWNRRSAEWLRRARADLDKAKREHEGAKR